MDVEIEIRSAALNAALGLHRNSGVEAKDIVAEAKVIEDYLVGIVPPKAQEEQEAEASPAQEKAA